MNSKRQIKIRETLLPLQSHVGGEGETLCKTPETTIHFPSLRNLRKMPAPKPLNWVKLHGTWENFCKAMHRSIGRNLGSGVMTFSENWDAPAKKARD